MKKILFFLLLSLIYSATLQVFQVKNWDKIKVKGQNGLVCYELNNAISEDNTFYLHISCEDVDKTINKTIYYNFSNVSCTSLKHQEIDINNPKNQFDNILDKTYSSTDKPKFRYEYEIKKTSAKQKYMLFLYKDFNGNEFEVGFDPFSGIGVLIIVLIVIGAIIFLIILVVAIVCLCYRSRKHRATAPQYQISFTQEPQEPKEPIMAEENAIQ